MIDFNKIVVILAAKTEIKVYSPTLIRLCFFIASAIFSINKSIHNRFIDFVGHVGVEF
jgi:hypothetical protein